MKKKMRNFFTLNHKANDGFTLVELIVVIAILAILGGVAVPAYSGYIDKAKRAGDEQLLAALNTAYATACMENGKYDMKNLGFTPATVGNIQEDVVMNEFDDSFQIYYAGNGAFKYFDAIKFIQTDGVFKGTTVEELVAALQKAWTGSSFKDVDVNKILKQFDDIGNKFGSFSWTALDGFPTTVLDALGLSGLSDVTTEEAEAYLSEKYGRDWNSMSDEEKNTLITNYKSNASTMQILSVAGNYEAEDIVENIGKFVEVMGGYNENDSDFQKGLITYYNELHGYQEGDDGYTDDYETAKFNLSVTDMLSGDQVYALATSGMENTAGAGTLGAMYALAMAYNKGAEGKDYGSFDTFQETMKSDGFLGYLGIVVGDDGVTTDYANAQAMKDIEAYQSFAQYLSTGDIDMGSADAFEKLLSYMTGALS